MYNEFYVENIMTGLKNTTICQIIFKAVFNLFKKYPEVHFVNNKMVKIDTTLIIIIVINLIC